MAFGVFHGELAAAIGSVLKGTDDGSFGGYCAGMNRIGVGDDDVDAAGLDAVHISRRLEAAAIFVILFGAEHDHAIAEDEFGVADGSIFAFVDGMEGEAKHLAKPGNGVWGVSVAMGWDDGAAGFGHGGPRSSRGRVARNYLQ